MSLLNLIIARKVIVCILCNVGKHDDYKFPVCYDTINTMENLRQSYLLLDVFNNWLKFIEMCAGVMEILTLKNEYELMFKKIIFSKI